jgi:hypothetical protein
MRTRTAKPAGTAQVRNYGDVFCWWGGRPVPLKYARPLVGSAKDAPRKSAPDEESRPSGWSCEATSRGEFAPGNRVPVQGLMKHHIGRA